MSSRSRSSKTCVSQDALIVTAGRLAQETSWNKNCWRRYYYRRGREEMFTSLRDIMQTERDEQRLWRERCGKIPFGVRFVLWDHEVAPSQRPPSVCLRQRARQWWGSQGILPGPERALHPPRGHPVGEGPSRADLSSLHPSRSPRPGDVCSTAGAGRAHALGRCPRVACSCAALFATGGTCRRLFPVELRRVPEGPLEGPVLGQLRSTAAAEFIAELAETLEEMGIRPEQCTPSGAREL